MTPSTPSGKEAGKDLVGFDSMLMEGGLNDGTSLPLGSDAFWGLFSDIRGSELEHHPHKAYENPYFPGACFKSSAEEPHFYADDQRLYTHSAIATDLDHGRTTSGVSSIRLASEPSEGDGFSSVPSLSISASSSSSPPCIDLPSTCRCLQQHAELLCLLKNLERGENALSIDVVLTSAQQALVPWQSLIQCRICQHDDDHSVLHLSVMSIRAVLRHLQRLYADKMYNASTSDYSTPAHQNPTSVKVTIGSFEVKGNEHKFVTDFVILRALDRIGFALNSLKGKLRQSRDQTVKFNPMSLSATNMQHLENEHQLSSIEHLLRSVEGTMQAVKSAIKTTLAATHEHSNDALGSS
ncbi:hypothetical protein MMC11_006866 [Xylographa trunciseda]|nr:hypothetical protein [Xylographa trunciseda]